MESKTRIIIVGIVLLLVVGMIVFFTLGRKSAPKAPEPKIENNKPAASNPVSTPAPVTTPVSTPAQTPVPTPATQPDTVKYINSDYGFDFTLPATWKGYTIINEKWEGDAQSGNGEVKVAEGPEILIRHPLWNAQKPRQDIPIMVFTIQQWNDMHKDKFHIGAAPINPSELGRNARYVFALPARYNYAYPFGWEGVQKIIEGNPLHAF